jgi:sugar (pentulose or hexulose) kinase
MPSLQVVHLLEVLAPALVDDAQHHLPLDLAHHVLAHLGLAALVVVHGLGHDHVVELVGGSALGERSAVSVVGQNR